MNADGYEQVAFAEGGGAAGVYVECLRRGMPVLALMLRHYGGTRLLNRERWSGPSLSIIEPTTAAATEGNAVFVSVNFCLPEHSLPNARALPTGYQNG